MVAITYAAPSGPHPVGVRDGEVLDVKYPAMRPEDADGRRLMVRVWYPASSGGGARRPYLVGDEAQLLRWFVEAAGGLPAEWVDRLAEVTTHSVEDAEAAPGPFPALVFSHGALGWVSQNSPLMEHLASHGYIVWGLTHPGESCGIRYPGGELVRYDDSFAEALAGLATQPNYMDKLTGDVGRRFEVTPQFLDDHAMGRRSQRWVDDMRAVIDAIESKSVSGSAMQLAAASDLDRLGVFGMSFGAGAACSTAQQDHRVKGVVNLDGGPFLSDLFDTGIRVPLLHLASNLPGMLTAIGMQDITTIDANEFFHEPLRTLGTRADVHRLCIKDITHQELSDLVLIPAEDRAGALPAAGKAEPQPTIDLLNAFIGAYFDTVLLGQDSGFPHRQLDEFPEVTPMDLSPIREWALTQEPNR